MTNIRIERISEWNNKLRAIELYINGEKVGNIKDGEIQEYEIDSGTHEIFAKIDWCRSPKIKLNIAENETKVMELGGFKYSKWVLFASLGILLLYYLVKHALIIDLHFLIWVVPIGLLYPFYYITFGRNRYLILTEKENKNVLQQKV